MKPQLQVVKIGGKLINHKEKLSSFLEQFVSINSPKILIHGGGQKATELSALLGVETRMIDGRRITDADTLEIAVMVYAGLINKSIVADLQSLGVNAIGLSGADANIIHAERRPKGAIDYGFVGDIKRINASVLNDFISRNIVPVLCPISHNGNGQLFNTNADTIAAQVAISLSNDYSVQLSYCFEFDGVLYDIDTPDLTITQISHAEFIELRNSQSISKGMIPKLSNGFDALNGGVKRVNVCGIENLLSLQGATLLTL